MTSNHPTHEGAVPAGMLEVTQVHGWRAKDGTIYSGDGYPVPLRRFVLDNENCAALLVAAPASPTVPADAEVEEIALAFLTEWYDWPRDDAENFYAALDGERHDASLQAARTILAALSPRPTTVGDSDAEMAAAVEAERERCAAIADSFAEQNRRHGFAADGEECAMIAASIRAQGEGQ